MDYTFFYSQTTAIKATVLSLQSKAGHKKKKKQTTIYVENSKRQLVSDKTIDRLIALNELK